MVTLYEDSVMPEGKHKGKLVRDVAQQDPSFLRKFQRYSNTHCISDEVMENLESYQLTPGPRLLGADSEAVE